MRIEKSEAVYGGGEPELDDSDLQTSSITGGGWHAIIDSDSYSVKLVVTCDFQMSQNFPSHLLCTSHPHGEKPVH